jgi:hypothetical protein
MINNNRTTHGAPGALEGAKAETAPAAASRAYRRIARMDAAGIDTQLLRLSSAKAFDPAEAVSAGEAMPLDPADEKALFEDYAARVFGL